jgi:hypothetical protein
MNVQKFWLTFKIDVNFCTVYISKVKLGSFNPKEGLDRGSSKIRSCMVSVK